MCAERHATTSVGRKYPVQHERVNVHVQVQGRAKARQTLAVAQMRCLRAEGLEVAPRLSARR